MITGREEVGVVAGVVGAGDEDVAGACSPGTTGTAARGVT
jgi:hypothetical protein